LNSINRKQIDINEKDYPKKSKYIGAIYEQIKLDKYYKQLLEESTNFYDLFRNPEKKFVYNLKHLNSDYKNEIDAIMNRFIKDNYVETCKNENFNKNLENPYFSWAHYPNSLHYSVYHQYIVRFTAKGDPGTRKDMLYKYLSTGHKRRILWKEIKSIDYIRVPMLLEFEGKMLAKLEKPTEENINSVKKFISEKIDKFKMMKNFITQFEHFIF